jgi:hypothetical protein
MFDRISALLDIPKDSIIGIMAVLLAVIVCCCTTGNKSNDK